MLDQNRNRPTRLIILTMLVFCFTLWNGLRLGEAVFFWKTLLEYGSHPIYISTSGGVWLVSGLLLTWGLWQGKPWAWSVAILATLGYAAWYWIDRLIIQKPHANWPFALVATIVLLSLFLYILISHKIRRFFQREHHERKS